MTGSIREGVLHNQSRMVLGMLADSISVVLMFAREGWLLSFATVVQWTSIAINSRDAAIVGLLAGLDSHDR